MQKSIFKLRNLLLIPPERNQYNSLTKKMKIVEITIQHLCDIQVIKIQAYTGEKQKVTRIPMKRIGIESVRPENIRNY